MEQAALKADAGQQHRLDHDRLDTILLFMILVAFMEATAQPLRAQPPALVRGFAGIQSSRIEADERT